MGFDNHMILGAVPVLLLTRRNGHQAINRTSRHYAEALSTGPLGSMRIATASPGAAGAVDCGTPHHP
jgi:hypothetical protein